ncbi:simple sugar transport system ATP-binding protein [Mycoplasma testudineum]|uniref:Simple sugar transport system ATP-binding protein n=1 Tax=Mycoplasma testudineum TaxID=244584 RepID=A0A4R6IG19_9MOLU|nr:ABC transporter ATP-binding protein [Mycoplasma testudineum]OYD26749.1 sugar ABC transporter ATP-binding protein [Mycoplasma testudineum]TDO19885.1 simple sugar transport system ATP-binding protein [Mycoplasma testudineum]
MKNYAIEFKHLTKEFPGIKANDNISFAVEKGTVHSLIGENGAGKSTLMSILFGLYSPTSGEILINGNPTAIKGPNQANDLGIAMVHQHFKLIDNYTNLQNIILGNETTLAGGILTTKSAADKIKAIQNKYNLHFDLNQKTGSATVATQQKVEIMKMLYRDADILILDEPTAVLTPQEITGLLETIKTFRDAGKTILFISHKLNEVKEVSDRATVIRHGKVIQTFDSLESVNPEDMSAAMVGEKVVLPKNNSSILFEKNPTIVEFENVFAKGNKELTNLNFEIKAGEILAIAGVEGNGQEELEFLAGGLIKPTTGRISFKDYYSYSKDNEVAKKVIKREKSAFNKKMYEILEFMNFWLSRDYKNFVLDFFRKNHDGSKTRYSILKSTKKLSKGHFSRPKTHTSLKDGMIDISQLSVSKRKKYGLSYIPGDRHKYGLVLDFNIRDNSVIRKLSNPDTVKFGIILKKNVSDFFKQIESKFDVRGARSGVSMARSLSGGNQQKAIVGREILDEHQFIVVVQPTRGLDVGAINNIHNYILEEKAKNKAILLISYELDEVLALADNVAVIHEGKLSKKIPISQVNRTEIGLMMAGAK